MPRAGLDAAVVTAAAADLADEIGLQGITMSLLAGRLGVKAPSLYKHVESQAALRRAVGVLALTELEDAVGSAIASAAPGERLDAAAAAIRTYVQRHPGRYAATVSVDPASSEDPLTVAGGRLMDTLAGTLVAYAIPETQLVHALRLVRSLLHGFVALEQADGFLIAVDTDESFRWMIAFVDRGLRALAGEGGRED